MLRFRPYFSDDTDGVHFEVCVDGQWVLAHVGRQVLARHYGVRVEASNCLTVFQDHCADIVETAAQHATLKGRQTVILQLTDFAAATARR